MSQDRTTNSIRNSISGLINKIINIIMPFIVRTVIIYYLGMEYAGLNSLFSSVLQVLNLAELGISSAVVYCMYKPMATNDTELLCALINYMRKLYYIIGCVVAGLGLIIMPFLPHLIKGSVPDNLNIYILYGFYLIYTIIGYFFYAYKSTLLNSGQKVGVISNINSGVVLIQSVVQIVIIVLLKNYYLFLVMLSVFAVINNIWISYAVRIEFPDISCRNSLPESIKKDLSKRVKGLFVSRVCNTTRNAFDSIFISSFLGLNIVAIYGNYYYAMAAVVSVLKVITIAITSSVGNSLVTESVEKNYNDMRRFNFIFDWFVGFSACCMLTMYQPFMKIWVGKDSLFQFEVVVLFCIYFYFLNVGSIRAVYHDAAGLWWEARYRAIIEAALNIVLNILLTKALGVAGTVLGTLISLVAVNYIYGTQIVFKYYFKDISPKQYFIDNTIYLLASIGISVVVYYINSLFIVEGISSIVIPFIICLIMFNILYYFCFSRTKIYKDSIGVLHNIVRHVKIR